MALIAQTTALFTAPAVSEPDCGSCDDFDMVALCLAQLYD